MISRDTIKRVVQFGKREYSEKKPLNLYVYRIKSKTVLSRGMLPSLSIRLIQGTFFIILSEYKDEYRIYSFSKDGAMLGAENLQKTSEIEKKLAKSTQLIYHLPKEKKELTIDDITAYFRLEFGKILEKFNKILGLSIKYSRSIVAEKELKIYMVSRNFGAAKTKEFLKITPELYKKDIFEAVAIREILFTYLNDLLVLNQRIDDFQVFYYDLALLLTNFYCENKHNEYIKTIMEKTTISFLNFEDKEFFLSDQIIGILKNTLGQIESKKVLVFLSNLFHCLKILKDYEIKLSIREFANMYVSICELFKPNSSIDFFSTLNPSSYYAFHFKCFYKALEQQKNLIIIYSEKKHEYLGQAELSAKKTIFLCLSFRLFNPQDEFLKNGPKDTSIIDINAQILPLIQSLTEFTGIPIIKNEIANYKRLLEDGLVSHLFRDIIKWSIAHEIKKETIIVELSFKNETDFTFQDFKYKLNWKPRNRIELLKSEESIKSRDLHNALKTIYMFTIKDSGKISFFCDISFSNILGFESPMKTVIKILTINLEKERETLI